MVLKPKRWRIAAPLSPLELSHYGDLHPILAQILHQRGFRSRTDALAFLQGDAGQVDPFKLRGISQAVSRIRTALKRKEKIVVYGDFDADGVTSTALLTLTLRALGADVSPYIPHRVDEGYGLNDGALIGLAKRGFKLCITVDCGIRSVHEVATGNTAGLDMIVTDHHSIGTELPPALAVINPKQDGDQSGEPMLAGVGVTFRLAEALLKVAATQDKRELPLHAEDLVDLVAIGTVADLVPLDRPQNRDLVVRGLSKLRTSERIGVRALLKEAGIEPQYVTAESIGFGIAPRINAAGRLKSALIAYELLSTQEIDEAVQKASELNRLNQQRQQLTRDMQAHARNIAEIDGETPLIFAADHGFAQGIVGLVAGRLTEEYYRPTVIVHRGEHESHGSCRSIPEFDITAALDQCADLLLRHGGHAQAAGFAIHNENLPSFRERMLEIAGDQLYGKELTPALEIDAEVIFPQLDFELYGALRALEPCGNSNPSPLLCARRLRVVEARAVGKDGSHLKLEFSDGKRSFKGIAFGMGNVADALPREVDVAFSLSINTWGGEERLELNVSDLRPAS